VPIQADLREPRHKDQRCATWEQTPGACHRGPVVWATGARAARLGRTAAWSGVAQSPSAGVPSSLAAIHLRRYGIRGRWLRPRQVFRVIHQGFLHDLVVVPFGDGEESTSNAFQVGGISLPSGPRIGPLMVPVKREVEQVQSPEAKSTWYGRFLT
jgi:hypothetical protein